VTVEAPRLVECARCGSVFELSGSNVRKARRLGRPLVCGGCRHPARPEEDARRLEAMKRWWLARYSLDELRSWPAL
jgi:hypothetical protein